MNVSEEHKKNLALLSEADKLQDKTLQALQRAQRDASRTEELGVDTLEELRKQGNQMDDINNNVDRLHHKLETSSVLQRNFERLTGNVLSLGHAFVRAKSSQTPSKLQFKNVNEVFEDQVYDNLFRTWKPHALVDCVDLANDCTDLFDPAVEEKMEHSNWIVDYSMVNIDPNGWTYATTFSALNNFSSGQANPQFNSFVRRRKWRYVRVEGIRGLSPMKEVIYRNEKRKNSMAEDLKPVRKVGYVPRDRQDSLTDTGLTSAGMLSRTPSPTKLDPVSAAGMTRLTEKDVQIDKGLDVLGQSIDRIESISNAMKQELTHQNQRLDQLENNMATSSNKMHEVNTRARRLLNTN